MGAHAQRHVPPLEARQLGNAQAGLHGHQQQGVVAAAEPGVEVGRGQHGGDLRPRQEGDQAPGVALPRDGQHPVDLRGVGRLLEGRIAEEGADRGEPEVAAAGGDPPPRLQVVQEGGDQRGIERREGEAGRRRVQVLVREAEQEAEGVPV